MTIFTAMKEMQARKLTENGAASYNTAGNGALLDLFALAGSLRSRIDDVALSDCDSLEEVRKGNYHLHSLCELLEKRYVTVEVEDDRDIRNGKALSLDCGAERVFLKKGETPLAVCERREDGKYHSLRGLF